jgi:DNA polymerase-3 subunit chi
MTQVDFYQLGAEPLERTACLLASKTIGAGKRLLVVSEDFEQLEGISRALWEAKPEEFLANAIAGGEHDARQPILLSGDCDAGNQADYILFADGQWRDEGTGFERAFLLFGEDTLQGARACWRGLDGQDGVTRNYWANEDGRWQKKA